MKKHKELNLVRIKRNYRKTVQTIVVQVVQVLNQFVTVSCCHPEQKCHEVGAIIKASDAADC